MWWWPSFCALLFLLKIFFNAFIYDVSALVFLCLIVAPCKVAGPMLDSRRVQQASNHFLAFLLFHQQAECPESHKDETTDSSSSILMPLRSVPKNCRFNSPPSITLFFKSSFYPWFHTLPLAVRNNKRLISGADVIDTVRARARCCCSTFNEGEQQFLSSLLVVLHGPARHFRAQK